MFSWAFSRRSLSLIVLGVAILATTRWHTSFPNNYEEDIKHVIGISIGTTHSCVAIRRHGAIEVIPNDLGHRSRPNPVIDPHQAQTEVLASIFSQLKQSAESYLGEPVRHAVVAGSQWADETQRLAIHEAGKRAALNILRIIHEPTAALLAYNLTTQSGEHYAVVYNLGATSLNVSLMMIDDGVPEVLVSSNGTYPAGRDFDKAVVNYLFQTQSQQSNRDALGPLDRYHVEALTREVEQAKHRLSTDTSAVIRMHGAASNEPESSVSLTREMFEEINDGLFRKALEGLDEVFKGTQIQRHDVEAIVLAGGSANIPKIQQLVDEYFEKPSLKSIAPEEVFAHGAARIGGILSGDQDDEDYLFTELYPVSFGVETSGGVFTKIFHRATYLPAKRFQNFTTSVDNQTSMFIRVFEGERFLVEDNYLIGEFEIRDIPPAPKGVPIIEVEMEASPGGPLIVRAYDYNSLYTDRHDRGPNLSITFTNDDFDYMYKLLEDGERFAVQDEIRNELYLSQNNPLGIRSIDSCRNTAASEPDYYTQFDL